MAATCLFFTCVAIALLALGIESQASDAHSAMVQSRGLRLSGTVVAVPTCPSCAAASG
ncbi:MAG TPA: hypothetical protein VMD09_02570 [Solirubrobacteraceae bacterium]|nr:hypothetical protein [Solirubrobacteraceae bacterium]